MHPVSTQSSLGFNQAAIDLFAQVQQKEKAPLPKVAVVEPPPSPEQIAIDLLVDRGGAIGMWIAILWGVAQYIDIKGMIADWRKGQKGLADLSGKVGAVADSMDKNHEIYRGILTEMQTEIREVSHSIENMERDINYIKMKGGNN